MFLGPSGIGKTTLAKDLSEVTGLPFISASMSDLLPSTKDVNHKTMLSADTQDLYRQDYQLLNLRNKTFKDVDRYITDRSYIDNLAYFIYKQAKVIPSCEIDHFMGLCSMMLSQQCDLIIFLNFEPSYLHTWYTEDNDKRITNNYFQIEMSSLMYVAMQCMGYRKDKVTDHIKEDLFPPRVIYSKVPYEVGIIKTVYGDIPVLKISSPNYDERKQIIKNFIYQ
jgi:hypothetical protein